MENHSRKSLSIEERKELNIKHAADPKIGDYWQEMLVGICVVLDVYDNYIVICREKEDCGNNKWTWDLSRTQEMTKGEFFKWLTYDTNINATWAYVEPGHMMWAVELYKEGIMDEIKDDKVILRKKRVESGTITIYHGVKAGKLKKILKDVPDSVSLNFTNSLDIFQMNYTTEKS